MSNYEDNKLCLPKIFQDNMVLEQNKAVPVWGRGVDGAIVVVNLLKNGEVKSTSSTIIKDGVWRVDLSTPMAGYNYTLAVSSFGEDIVYTNVAIGAVWVCTGQSNIAWTVEDSNDAEEALKTCDNPKLRLFRSPPAFSDTPEFDVDASWELSNPQSVAIFSAIGYYFGEYLQKELDIPIGIIMCTQGGSKIRQWMSIDAVKESNYAHLYPDASKLFNATTSPIIPYAISGMCWFQGESNIAEVNHNQYIEDQPLLIQTYRKLWGTNFPFFFVQLAACQNDTPYMKAPSFREAQATTLRNVDNVGMVVAFDLGEEFNIHFGNKKPCGIRLAKVALAKVYGKDIVYQGPCFKSFSVDGNKAIIRLSNVYDELVVKGGTLKGFCIATSKDEEGHFVFTDDVQGEFIANDTIALWTNSDQTPLAVRYAFYNFGPCSVFNKDGFPLAPFRTDSEFYYKNRDDSSLAPFEILRDISF